MRRVLLPLLLVFHLVGCDSGDPEDEPFSLAVSVESSDGAPVSGLSVSVRYPYAAAAKAQEAEKGASLFVYAFPNPFRSVGETRLTLDQETAIQMELLRVDSTVAISVANGTFGAGAYAFILDGSVLPGGAYRLRTTGGGEEVERWLLKTDDLSYDVSEGISRHLGTLTGEGALLVTDRTLALPLYDVPAMTWIDDQGSELGEFRLSDQVEVVVTNGAREEVVTLRLVDGPNEVEIDW